MHKFVRQLITEWRRLELPTKGESVIVAVSGGADSTALLFALIDLKKRKKLHLDLVVAHFNHKLRGKDSDADEKFVKKIAEKNAFVFVSASGRITGDSDLEQRARSERYAFLEKLAKSNNAKIMLTAHTMNDQAETLLLNLIRGSGIDGLRAMPAVRPLGNKRKPTQVKLVRPLLRWAKREDTEDYCRDQKVRFRRDRMNDDPKFARVRVRKAIMPELAKLNPKIIETLAKTAALLQVDPSASKGITNGNGAELKLAELKLLPEISLNSALRAWLIKNRGDSRGLGLKHIEAIARLVISPKSGRIVELPGGDSVVKGGGRLAFRHIKLEY